MPLQNFGVVAHGGATERGWLYRLAQPTADAFDLLSLLHVFEWPAVFVRLSGPTEGGVTLDEEVSLAEAQGGQRVVHVPIGYPFATKDQLIVAADEIERWMAQGVNAFVHCARGHDRTRAAVIAWQVRHGGVPIDEALKDSEPFFDAIDHLIDAQHTALLRELAEELGR